MHICRHVCVVQRAIAVLLFKIHLPFFERRSLNVLELAKQARLAGWLGSARHLPISVSPVLGLEAHATVPQLCSED